MSMSQEAFCASLRSRNAHGHVTRSIPRGNLQGKCRTRIPGPAFCASLRSRNAHGQSTSAIFYGNLQAKWPGTPPRQLFCASLRSRNALGHFTRAMLCGNLQGKCRTRIPRRPFCASPRPAQSKCTWTCHKRHFVRKFTGKMPDASKTTSIEHRALTVTVRTPQCGHTVWGNKP